MCLADEEEMEQSFLTKPPHTSISVGQKLLRIYLEQTSKKLACNQVQKQGDNVYTTNFCCLLLLEYTDARSIFCGFKHTQPCTECTPYALYCYTKISSSYWTVFPTLTYKADIARQKVLQMPPVCIRFGTLVWVTCEESAPVSSSELSKDITQDDDIASTAKVTALENLPLVNIGMDSDWNFFNIVTVIKSKVWRESFLMPYILRSHYREKRTCCRSRTELSLLLITKKTLKLYRC